MASEEVNEAQNPVEQLHEVEKPIKAAAQPSDPKTSALTTTPPHSHRKYRVHLFTKDKLFYKNLMLTSLGFDTPANT